MSAALAGRSRSV